MRRSKSPRTFGVHTVLLLAGCATVDPRPDYDHAQREIRATTGLNEVYDPDEPALQQVKIRALLSDGLGLEEAQRLALLNNRRLQAGFFGLGVARADYVQSGLLANPSLSLAFLFPDTGGRVKWTADLVGNIAEIWQIPARQSVAREGLEQRILELSRFAGELVAATKEAYFESVAARGSREVARANLDLARRTLEGVRRQVTEGVASRTDEGLAESLALAAELAFQRTEREEVSATRRLATLLSLEDDVLAISLTDPLPRPESPGIERDALVAASLGARPDLRAAERAVAAAEQRVALERKRTIPEIGVGVSAERPEGGSVDFFVGPAAALELPLFDQNQAQVSRAEFALAQSRKEYEAIVAEAIQEVRAALDRADITSRAALFTTGQLVPQAERSVSLAEKAYALGDTTVLTLLEAQKIALEARRTEIEALLEAVLSRIAVERVAGMPLNASSDSKARP